MIPFVDLQAQFQAIREDIDAAIHGVITEGGFIRGAALGRFEAAFAESIGVRHAIGVSSGTDALHAAVRACGIGPGDEVISVPNTWISTVFSISYVGARPVLVDIDPSTLQMDADALERAITPRTKAVIPVHMFGHPAPMERIMEICRPRGIRVIEDVAQAPFARLNGRQVGTFGDLACYSFYPSKNLGCYGDGGAVVTNDDALAERVRRLSDYGQSERFLHQDIGYNFRLDTMQAGILLAKLPHLKDWTEMRRDRAGKYAAALAGLPVRPLVEAPGAQCCYHLYPVRVADRDRCLEYLRANDVMAQVHYPRPVHLQPCYEAMGWSRGDFPIAEESADTLLSLPIFPELSDAQIETVAQILTRFFH